MDPNATSKPKLSTEGQLYVTLAAAEQWLAANDFDGLEEARRDLTVLLMGAHRVDSHPEQEYPALQEDASCDRADALLRRPSATGGAGRGAG